MIGTNAIRTSEGKASFKNAKDLVIGGESEVYFFADGRNRLICRESHRVMYFVCDNALNPIGNGRELCEWISYKDFRKLNKVAI